MYKPAAKRRWGYFALPVLHGDRLIGKVDAKADARRRCCGCTPSTRTSGSPAHRGAVRAELDDLAVWLGLEKVDLAAVT
jgi:uncharacterized protein YcaQ